MSRNKFYMGLLVSVILVIIFYASYNMLNIGKEEVHYSVSVIVEDSSNGRWNAFKEGLNQGASDNRIYLNVVSTGKFASLAEECSIISRELENGADGVIMELCDSDDRNEDIWRTVRAEKVVLVETDVNSSQLFTTVMPDYYEMGRNLAEAVFDAQNVDPKTVKIGIVAGNQKQMSQQQCLGGFEDVVSEKGAQVAWIMQNQKTESNRVLEDNQRQNPVDILAALGNAETELAVDFLLENQELECGLYGIGRSEKAVYYLDKGLIQTLVVPNEYFMGYQSVESLAKKLDSYAASVESTEVDFLTVAKKDLYDEKNGMILFPTVR